ncbi:MAG: hypothetical protein ACOVOD_08055, partial [Rhodoferax sp.]
MGKSAIGEGGEEFVQGFDESVTGNQRLISTGLAQEGTEFKGALGEATAGSVIGAKLGAAVGGFAAARDKTQYIGDIAKTVPETQNLAPARIKQIGKIVQQYAANDNLEGLANLAAAPGDQGLAAKIAAKMTGRVETQPDTETTYTPSQEEQDLIDRSSALEKADGETQAAQQMAGGSTDETMAGGQDGAQADGQPVAQFGTYIPSETGSQPNTEAPIRLAKMLDEETGTGPITIEAATSLAKEHEQGYSQWAAQDTTPGAVRREPQGFIDGTVDNILATAYLQG